MTVNTRPLPDSDPIALLRVADLRTALERGELELRYAPVVVVPSGQVRGLAAEAVWDSPTRGLLPAERWLPLVVAKPFVRSVHWNQASDQEPHLFPHGGLLRPDGKPKPVVDWLAGFRKAHLD